MRSKHSRDNNLDAGDSVETVITPALSRSFGIKDSIGFAGCVQDGVATKLEHHSSIAECLQIRGTPAIMLNGRLWRYLPRNLSMSLRHRVGGVY